MDEQYVDKILEIGRKGTCTDQELSYFLPNLPDVANKELLLTLRGQYGIYTSHMTRREVLGISSEKNTHPLSKHDDELTLFNVTLIKGIHIIQSKAGYGTSSTTTIYNLLGTIIGKSPEKFINLYNWIALNGGNYYIEAGVTFEEAKIREQKT